MILRRSFCDPFRRDMPAACHGVDPVSMAVLGVTSVLGAASGARQARAQAGEANYMAQVARNDQQIARWNAQRALQQGQVQEDLQRQKTQRVIGARRAALAGQGGDIDTGSPVDIIGDIARAGELDARTVRNDAQVKAWKALLDADADAGRANLYDSRADDILRDADDSLLGRAFRLGRGKSLL
jgi:hypothetical protein